MDNIILSLIYWDPPRDAFTIPYLNLEIAWYGILFAFGFIAGYFIFVPMLARNFNQTKKIYDRDIANWAILADEFKKEKNAARLKLNRSIQQELQNLFPKEEPTAATKQKMLDTLNTMMMNEKISRQQIEELFPKAILPARKLSTIFTDRLTWFVVIGTIVGARLGHVFFYDWPYYSEHPLEIVMIRKGGLASHGGTVGVCIGLYLFMLWNRKEFPDISLLRLIDTIAVPTAFTVCCIRIGNFFNQEILGINSSLPWAVVFGHSADGTPPSPRHPVQLYEAAAYLSTFFLLYALWKRYGIDLKGGVLSGLFFIFVFGSRFFIDFLKMPQSMIIDEHFLQMGQYLSIPFVIVGFALLFLPQSGNKKS